MYYGRDKKPYKPSNLNLYHVWTFSSLELCTEISFRTLYPKNSPSLAMPTLIFPSVGSCPWRSEHCHHIILDLDAIAHFVVHIAQCCTIKPLSHVHFIIFYSGHRASRYCVTRFSAQSYWISCVFCHEMPNHKRTMHIHTDSAHNTTLPWSN